MVVFFQHSFLKQHLAIFAVMILFWLPGFIMPQQITATEDLTMPLYDLVARILDLSPYIMETTAFLLFMLSTFLFNSILTANQLIGRNSTMGALVFMMSMCSFNATVLSPFIMACPIILLVLHIMFMINQTEKPENYLLNVGVLLSLASFIYTPSAYLLLWAVLSLLFTGFDSLRYLLLPVTGFVMPYLLYAAFLYINGNLMSYYFAYSSYFSDFSLGLPKLTAMEWCVFLTSVILVLLSMLKINVFSADKPVFARKRIEIGIIMLLIALFLFFKKNSTVNDSVFFAAAPIYYSMALSNVNKKKIITVLMFILLAGLMIKQYIALIGIA